MYQQTNERKQSVSAYLKAKRFREARLTMRGYLKDAFLIFLGICSASFGLKGFLLTNHFIDGGITGISLLVSALSEWPVYLLIIMLNIPFILMGYKTLGIQFAIKTAIGITGLSLFIANVNFPNITDDNLLVAVFGGTFLGAGIGFAIRGGAVIDGTEVLAIYISRKIGATVGDVIIIINVLIFSTAAYFLSVEIALYSMITYFAASRTLDFIIEGIEEYVGVTIISSHSTEIKEMIINKLGRGVTVYQGKYGHGRRGEKRDLDIVYTVVTRLELNKLNAEIEKIEPNVFMVMTPVKDTRGGMIKQRPLKH